MKVSYLKLNFRENSINSIKNVFLAIVLLNYTDSYNMGIFLWSMMVHHEYFKEQNKQYLKMKVNKIGMKQCRPF